MLMEKRFQLIKKEYDDFDRSLLREGRLPLKDTGIGFWNAAISQEVFELFNKLKLQKYSHFLDLGSGDGRVVMIASLFTNATGIEIDRELVNKSAELQRILDIKNVNFIHKNFMEHDISGHDVVFINPDRPMYRGLEDKLLNELKGQLIVYGHHFHPTLLQKKKEFHLDANYAALYTK